MASARRISGSASASRLVTRSSPARLLRSRATAGWSGPKLLLVDGERAAHQRLRLGDPVGGLQQLGQIVEADGHVGMVGAEAPLVDGERATIERLGLGVAGW